MNLFRGGVLLLGVSGIVIAAGPMELPVQLSVSRGWEPQGAYCRLYNVKSVVTVQGTVKRVEKIVPMKGMGYGIHMILKTQSETIPVHLGPTWYVEKQRVQFESGDVVEVTGSRVYCDGKPIILAANIKKDDLTATYREPSGLPAWAGWKR